MNILFLIFINEYLSKTKVKFSIDFKLFICLNKFKIDSCCKLTQLLFLLEQNTIIRNLKFINTQ